MRNTPTPKKKKINWWLVVKKATFYLFGYSLFFLPGHQYFLSLQADWQPPSVLAASVNLPSLSDYPVNFTGQAAPWLSARSALVLDQNSAVILFEKNPLEQLLPASTVKIMTALVTMEHYQLDQVLTVRGASRQGQVMELAEGEQITVGSLLHGLLVASANDAAQVLAKNYPGGEQAFVIAMNRKAQALNLKNTYFTNPSGLNDDQEGSLLAGLSLTTAQDMARLAQEALKNPLFAQIVATPSVVVTDLSGQIRHELFNVNQLLGRVEGLKGVKTGWTEDAGECLVSLVERDGRSLVFVVLGSLDRFGETTKLVNWAFGNFRWEKITPAIQG